MIAAEIIRQVFDAGGQIVADGAELVLTAPRPLSADLLESLKFHKRDILAALTKADPIPSPPHSAIDLNLAASYDDPALAPFDTAYQRKAAAEPGYEPAAQARYCSECANRAADKRCLAWDRIGAPEGWKPVDKAPRRCRGFTPARDGGELGPLAALAHRDLPGVSPELTARLSAENLKDIAAAVLWWRVSITEPGGRVVGVDTPSGWTLADWQSYAERYHDPGCSVTPIAGLPKPRAPVNLDEALAAAYEGVAGIIPAQFQALLSPEDIADIEAGAIHTKTVHAYALSFAEGMRSGRLVPAVAPRP